MKTLKKYAVHFLILILHFFGHAQQDPEKVILSKLEEVLPGKVISPKKAWFIDQNGNKIGLEEYRGHWLIIDFWSTGCAPCTKDFPYLENFAKRHRDMFKVVAVSVDNSFKKYVKSAKKLKLDIPNYYGGFTYDNAIFNLNVKVYNTEDNRYRFQTSTPQYVLIDPNGKIVDKDLPRPSTEEFKRKVKIVIE